MSNTEICKLDDVPDNDAKGMVATVDGKQRNIFVARKGEQAFAYLNWCPHNQVLIDQIPNKFFNADYSFIQCSKHGALFQIEDGLCVEGPCEGESLKPLATSVENGVIYLVD
jgi:nitrite reductase/ring-hydroxylating ferredoxin subunit